MDMSDKDRLTDTSALGHLEKELGSGTMHEFANLPIEMRDELRRDAIKEMEALGKECTDELFEDLFLEAYDHLIWDSIKGYVVAPSDWDHYNFRESARLQHELIANGDTGPEVRPESFAICSEVLEWIKDTKGRSWLDIVTNYQPQIKLKRRSNTHGHR